MVQFDGMYPKIAKQKYPLCLDGERACPPEDVGGIGGYEDFLETIRNPKHEEHERMLEWVGGKYAPEEFDPRKIKFDNPSKRWEKAFRKE